LKLPSLNQYCFILFYFYYQSQGIWGPFLVIAPASTLHNWQQEVARFLPRYKVRAIPELNVGGGRHFFKTPTTHGILMIFVPPPIQYQNTF